jgi:protein-disulfide isomerase
VNPSRRAFLAASLLAVGGCSRTLIPVPAAAPRLGPTHAKLVVQEVGDFQCSFCAKAEPAVKRLLQSHGDRVALVWRDYPLAFHPDAELAAEAAREVRAELGDAAFWRYHDALFDHQAALATDDLLDYARPLGIDETRFRRALHEHTHRPEIAEERRSIDALGIPGFGTPTFLVEDHAYVGALSYDELVAVVENAL